MKKSYDNKQIEKFEIGTICIFAGLIFLTILPIFLKSMLYYMNPNSFKFFGALFFFAGGVFYYFSQHLYKKQLFVIGVNFLIFAFFQFFFSSSELKIYDITGIAALLAGGFLIIQK